jgi:hypothetical protein
METIVLLHEPLLRLRFSHSRNFVSIAISKELLGCIQSEPNNVTFCDSHCDAITYAMSSVDFYVMLLLADADLLVANACQADASELASDAMALAFESMCHLMPAFKYMTPITL